MPQKGKVKWIPKKWQSEYNRIVALAVLGRTNEEIAQETGYTKEHVSTIINLPEGQLLYEKLKNRIKEKIENDIPAHLEASAKKAAQRIYDILHNDDLATKAPFQMAALSQDILKGVGHLKTGLQAASPFTIVNNGQMVVTSQQKSELLEGLEKVNEVNRIHSLPVTTARIKDGTNG